MTLFVISTHMMRQAKGVAIGSASVVPSCHACRPYTRNSSSLTADGMRYSRERYSLRSLQLPKLKKIFTVKDNRKLQQIPMKIA